MPHASTSRLHSRAGSRTSAAPDSREHKEKASTLKPETSVHPIEPEDPKVTSISHSEQKRVLRQNVEDGQARQHPETPAGQHATGSFSTGTEKKR